MPPLAWLALLVGGSFLFRALLARSIAAPFIMVDELIYSEFAKSFAETGSFAIREVPAGGYGFVYPVLISPAYALFTSITDAYTALKAINALLMSLAAVPAYFISRRMMPPRWSLLSALLAVALPSLVYTGTVMTENAFYPLVLACVLALIALVERPTLANHIYLGLALAVTVATRVQGVALLAAVLVAPVLFVIFDRRSFRRGLAPYRWLYAVVLTGAVLVVGLQLARGQSVRDLLGAYAVVGDVDYSLDRLLRFVLWHAEEMTLYVGIVPVAATLVLLGDVRRQATPVKAFLAAALPVVVFSTIAVAAFASQFIDRVEERNLFPIATLFLIGLVVWAQQGAPRPVRLVVPAIAIAVALPLLFPYGTFISESASSDTLALLPLWSLYGDLLFSSVVWTVAAGALLAALVFLVLPRRYSVAIPLLVLVWFALATRAVWSGDHGFVRSAIGAYFQGIPGSPRDWIDQAMPSGRTASVVWTGTTDRFTVNTNEFFNRRLGPVYYIGGATPGNLPETRLLRAESHPRAVTYEDGRPFRDDFVLLDDSFDPDGRILARNRTESGNRMTLWQLYSPLRNVATVRGLYPEDTWSGKHVRYTRDPCRGGVLAFRAWADPNLTPVPPAFTIRQQGMVERRARPPADGAPLEMRVPLRVRNGRCQVDLEVARTTIPGPGDQRELGLHFAGFRLEST